MIRTFIITIILTVSVLPSICSSAEDAAWQSRTNGYEPFTTEELLAVRVMRSGTSSLKEPPYVAEIEDEDDDGTIVRVTRKPEDNSGIQYTYRFRMQGTNLVAAESPSFTQVVDERRSRHAREVAESAVKGTLSARPEIYDDYLYKPRVESRCHVVVDEYNSDREFQLTYEFNVCK